MINLIVALAIPKQSQPQRHPKQSKQCSNTKGTNKTNLNHASYIRCGLRPRPWVRPRPRERARNTWKNKVKHIEKCPMPRNAYSTFKDELRVTPAAKCIISCTRETPNTAQAAEYPNPKPPRFGQTHQRQTPQNLPKLHTRPREASGAAES